MGGVWHWFTHIRIKTSNPSRMPSGWSAPAWVSFPRQRPQQRGSSSIENVKDRQRLRGSEMLLVSLETLVFNLAKRKIKETIQVGLEAVD